MKESNTKKSEDDKKTKKKVLNLEKDEQIANLEKINLEKDEQIANLEKINLEKDEQIANLEKINLEKDEQIANLEKINLEKDEQIANLERFRVYSVELGEKLNFLERDKKEKIKYGNERLISKLLFFIDNYEEALEFSTQLGQKEEIVKKFLSGFEMTLRKFKDILGSEGVKEIEIIPEKDNFNISLHKQKIDEENVNKKDYDSTTFRTISRVSQKGYLIHGRVLRKAEVEIEKTHNKK